MNAEHKPAPGGMRVLVTGASGMLGRSVAEALIARGDHVTVLQRRPAGVSGAAEVLGSIEDETAVARAVAGKDAVVHLAAKVTMTGDLADFERINIGGTRSLLRAAQLAGVARFVHMSTPSVAHTGSSIVGEGAGPADPQHTRGPYARTKAAAEIEALGADAPGFAVAAIRPHIVWGPGDTQLVQRVIDRASAGRLPILGSGASLVDTTYVDDAVSATVAALDRAEAPEAHGRAFVVSGGDPRPIAEILAAWCGAAGVQPPSRSLPPALVKAAGSLVEGLWALLPEGATTRLSEDGEPPMTRFLAEQLSTAHWFDIRRTRQALGWEPRVGFAAGVAALARDFRDQAHAR